MPKKKGYGGASLDEGISDSRNTSDGRPLGQGKHASRPVPMIADTRQRSTRSSDFVPKGQRHWPKADTNFPNRD